MGDFWRSRRVLVTGIAGFLGGHLTRALIDLEADVVGLDLVADSPCLRVHGLSGTVPVLVRDLAGDPDRVIWALAHGAGGEWRPPEVVVHLAGPSHIRWCQDHPLGAWEGHLRGTWNVLEACRRLDPAPVAVVLASSNHVYGSLPEHRAALGIEYLGGFPEPAHLRQTDVYGTAKACVDLLMRAYGRGYGLPVASLRHVNAAGEADPHASHLITSTILSLLRGEAPLIKSDGTPTKAYLDVRDVVSAYLLLAEGVAARAIPFGEAWNAAPAAPISVEHLVAKLVSISGVPVVPVVTGEDLSQSGYVEMLDSQKLRQLGWTPDDSYGHWLARVWAWYHTHGGMAWTQ